MDGHHTVKLFHSVPVYATMYIFVFLSATGRAVLLTGLSLSSVYGFSTYFTSKYEKISYDTC